MLVWVILPNFDATKSIQHFYIAKEDHKAPWRNSILPLNFQLMAANGYIVVATQIVAECLGYGVETANQ
jgi:hypothetical protein